MFANSAFDRARTDPIPTARPPAHASRTSAPRLQDPLGAAHSREGSAATPVRPSQICSRPYSPSLAGLRLCYLIQEAKLFRINALGFKRGLALTFFYLTGLDGLARR